MAWFVETFLEIFSGVIKNSLLDEFRDSKLFIEFGKGMLMFGGWCEETFM